MIYKFQIFFVFHINTHTKRRQDADGRKLQHHHQQVVSRENFLHQRATGVVLGRGDRRGESAGVHRSQPGVHKSVSDGGRRRQHICCRPQAPAVTTFQLFTKVYELFSTCSVYLNFIRNIKFFIRLSLKSYQV